MKRPRKKSPKLYDTSVYLGMSTSGEITIPMTGWDIQQICGGGYQAALAFAKDPQTKKWLERYSDELIYKVTKESYGNRDDFKSRENCMAFLLDGFAWEIADSNSPNIYLACDILQQQWGE